MRFQHVVQNSSRVYRKFLHRVGSVQSLHWNVKRINLDIIRFQELIPSLSTPTRTVIKN